MIISNKKADTQLRRPHVLKMNPFELTNLKMRLKKFIVNSGAWVIWKKEIIYELQAELYLSTLLIH